MVDSFPQQEESSQKPRLGVEQPFLADTPWLLIVLSVVAVLPVWTVRYPVVTDYPNHLARWFVLFHIKDGAYHFADFYAPAWGALPYISPDVLAIGLQYLLPIDVVGRCILSLCIFLVAFATYFFLKQACPENTALASFGIVIAFSPNFLMGSISNQFSLAFCLIAVSLWVSYCRSPKVITAAGIVISQLLVYFSHLIGFIVAGTVMGVYALFQEQRWKKVRILATLSLPALAMYAFRPKHDNTDTAFLYFDHVVMAKLKNLLFPLRLYTSKSVDLILLLALVLLIVIAWKSKARVVQQRAWLIVCAVLLLAYIVAPRNYGYRGGFVDVRILLFLYLFLLGAWRFERVPRYLYYGLALLVLFRVASVEQMFLARQPGLRQMTAAFDVMPRDARVLKIVRLEQIPLVGSGGIHHLDYGVIQRGFLDPTLFHLPGIQPIRLKDSTYCPDIACYVTASPDMDWKKVSETYDYLWIHLNPDMPDYASRIGDVVFSNDSVIVYRVRRSQL